MPPRPSYVVRALQPAIVLRVCWVILLSCAVVAAAQSAEPPTPPGKQPAGAAANRVASPVSAADSIPLFRLDEGLQIQVAASEPQVIDPVEIRFDEDGRMWVVEMRDYPGSRSPDAPQSRIRILRDRDGDGVYETSTLFVDGLPFATGLQPWDGGAIVTIAGQIVFLKDTDGDGLADERQTWFSGFSETNPQLRANHPRFALDNTVYVAGGLRGGAVVSDRLPNEPPVSISCRDFRFDPRTGYGQAASGNGQFGLAFDDFGNRFTCSNRNPLVHVVLAEKYLAANSQAIVPSATVDVAAAGEASRVYPISQAWTTSILHAGQFTAACGATIYRGDALGSEYSGNAFICEPTGNLVHRELLSAEGATFRGEPAAGGRDFLASPDTWFRPVNLELGPDGCLYVVDMYRAVIEHPEWVPEELKNRPDERFGDDRGRIYRIAPQGFSRPSAAVQLSDAPGEQLVGLLEHPSAWWRETAARLMYQRQDHAIVPLLASLVRHASDPRARAHALWALEGMSCLDEPVLAAGLVDVSPRVRLQAAILAEPRLGKSAKLRHLVLALADDPDAALQFQVALSLTKMPADQADSVQQALERTALSRTADVWTRQAVCIATPKPARLLIAVIRGGDNGAAQLAMSRQLSEMVGLSDQPRELQAVLSSLTDLPDTTNAARLRSAVLVGLASGARRLGSSLTEVLAGLLPQAGDLVDIARNWLESSAQVALDPEAEPDIRTEACRLLAHAPASVAVPALLRLAAGPPSPEIGRAAVESLAVHEDDRVGPALVELFRAQTPALRGPVLDSLLSRSPWAGLLLDAIADGRITATLIDPLAARRLLEYEDESIRTRAEQLLAAAVPSDRERILADYRSALSMEGDPARGREVFRKNCTACHKINGDGVDVAPSIADERTKTPQQLLVDILAPSRAIDNAYGSYSITTQAGDSLVGIITSESANSITLKQPEGKQISLLRSEIDEISSTGVSLMPDGLERQVSPAEMADLIAYIKNWRYQ